MEKNMMSALLEQFTLHTRLFSNVLVEISPEHATKRMNDKTNHIAWLTGSMVSIRFKLANLLGMNEQEPFPHLFKDGKAIQNDITYPGINESAVMPGGAITPFARPHSSPRPSPHRHQR